MRFTAVSVAAVLFVCLSPSSGSAGESIAVPMDEVRTITFDRPVATVYVGNPAVADIQMIDPTHAFILGKSFGATNLLALDGKGDEIANQHVTVLDRGDAIVTLNRGASQVTYACASARCESAPMPGDQKDAFDTATNQIQQHQEMGEKAATASH